MNFVDRYMKFAEPLTESPRTFHFYMAYLILSMVIGKKAYYEGAGSFPLSPNLWFVLLGPSSMTKKSTMLRIATDHILRNVFEGQFKVAAEGSHESFMEDLEKTPTCLIAHDEFANLMAWLNKDYNGGLMGCLTHLYDQPATYTRSVGTREKKRVFTVKEPFINVASCSTIEWFNKTLKEENVTGGFLPRFCLVLEKADSKDIPETPPIDKTLQADMIMELQGIMARLTNPTPFKYNEPARKTYCDWYVNFKKKLREAPSISIPFYSRRISDLHKFAMIHAVMRGESTMNEADLDGAIGVVEQICEYTDELLGNKVAFTPYQADRRKVLEIIEKLSNRNGGAARWQVLKNSKLKVRDFNDIIQSLTEEESIVPSDTKSAAGRKQILYKVNAEVPA